MKTAPSRCSSEQEDMNGAKLENKLSMVGKSDAASK